MQARNTNWTVPIVLGTLTFATTLYAGAAMVVGRPPTSLTELQTGWVFSLPLMAILLAHEFAHFFAGRHHQVAVSPPYFIPLPFLGIGTLGAVIQIRSRIRSRNALLDIGVSGPLAGFAVTLPVLIYGLVTSPVEPLPDTPYLLEGRSMLYLGLLWMIKGPIPAEHDIMLNPTAFAGWVGLLVTMINLLPFGQLDGGHIAYALRGPSQDRTSAWLLRALPVLSVVICAVYGIPSYLEGHRGLRLSQDALAGMQWMIWAFFLWTLTKLSGTAHPPTQDDTLSSKRRWVGWITLSLFALLFMPTWFRQQ